MKDLDWVHFFLYVPGFAGIEIVPVIVFIQAAERELTSFFHNPEVKLLTHYKNDYKISEIIE